MSKPQAMMSLHKLRMTRTEALPGAAIALMPRFTSDWNVKKGPIDVMSKILAQLMAKFGSISPIVALHIRLLF